MRARTIAAIGVAVGLGGGMAVFGPAVSVAAKNPNLQNLTNELNKAKHITYYAKYENVSGGQTTTITIAQAPPKSLFSSSDGSLAVNTGKATYYCSANSASSGGTGSTGSGNSGSGNSGSGNSGNTGSTTTTTTKSKSSEQCYSEKGANPLVSTEALFSGAALTGVFAQAEESAIARALGIHVSTSSGNYGGQSATCVTVTRRGQGAKYCVTSQGILAYESTGKSNYFELTKYSNHPPSSVFQLPSGATTVTIPSLPSGSTP
jgi:hypothetical protein